MQDATVFLGRRRRRPVGSTIPPRICPRVDGVFHDSDSSEDEVWVLIRVYVSVRSINGHVRHRRLL